jgi:polynucleotide 5'-hydroxyl-kinase GRC3/NOL9
MPGKRKRVEGAGATGKPLTAIAAARLRTEAAAKVVNTPEVTFEPTPAPADALVEIKESGDEESDVEEEDAPVQRNLRLCNWRNEPQNIISDTDTELTVNLNKHATIALIGCFEFKVLRGAIHINGANIGTVSRDGQKNRMHRACVPATHPISKIRGLDGSNHVLFRTCKAPTPFAHMSPLFDDLWNASSHFEKERSFRVVSASVFYAVNVKVDL